MPNAAGAALQDVADVQVLPARFEDFAGMNESCARFFPIDPPARSDAKLGVQLPGVPTGMRRRHATPATASTASAWTATTPCNTSTREARPMPACANGSKR